MSMRIGQLPAAFHILDRTRCSLTGDILVPFAIDELICREVAGGRIPVIHMWRHQQAFVMGLRDRRLPSALKAMAHLEQKGYSVTVRHSGGAAVPLDGGVVNISIILPKDSSDLEFNPYFELMYRLLRQAILPFSIRVDRGEVEGSYCPGDYDLSVGGRKFCGLAQRRQMKAFVVQAFVSVEGNAQKRAGLAKAFYDKATSLEEVIENPSSESKTDTLLSYPQVTPESMISLQQLNAKITIGSFVESLTAHLLSLGGSPLAWDLLGIEPELVEQEIQKLRRNYEKR